jgi:ribosomal protein L7/L12
MSSGLWFALGVAVGVAVGSALTALLYARRRPAPEPTGEVSEETMAKARELVAQGRIVHAVKAVQDETGWDLRRAKAVVDRIPRARRRDQGPYGGLS